jgi:hypothetical protein
MSGGFASIVFSIRQGGGPIQIRPLAYLDSGRPTGSRPGWTLTNIGDVDGDRIDDIASGNPAPGTPNSRIEFFSGADMVQPGSRWRRISSFSEFYTEDPYSLMGYGRNSVIGIPDMNGDGINEVAIGDMGTSEVFIVRP